MGLINSKENWECPQCGKRETLEQIEGGYYCDYWSCQTSFSTLSMKFWNEYFFKIYIIGLAGMVGFLLAL